MDEVTRICIEVVCTYAVVYAARTTVPKDKSVFTINNNM